MPGQFDAALEFDWDAGNIEKSWLKHQVSQKDSESTFKDPASVLALDPSHSQSDKRFQLIGNSESNKLLNIIFTIRNHKIRIISARSANQKERNLYEKIK